MTNLFNAYNTLTNITDAVNVPVIDPITGQTKKTSFQAIKTFIGALGSTGATGVTGATGPKGTDGVDGVNGTTGATGYIGSTGATGVTGYQGATGSTGPAGADGRSVTIVGSLQSEINLPVPYTGDRGDGYLINDTKDLWVWDGVAWNNIGNILGPQGATGSTGPVGVAGGITYPVSAAGMSAYTIAGISNPSLTLVKGFTYYFNVSAPGHPFWIKTSQTTGIGDAYNSGVTNNGASSGVVTFTVPFDAPSVLYYICQFHASMTGTINIADTIRGPQGNIGATGATGSIGIQGATGPQGYDGATGSTGPMGPIGTTLPATTTTLGGLIVGHNLSITSEGTLSSILSVTGDIPPTDAVEGDQWWDSFYGRGYVYYSGTWVEMSPQPFVVTDANGLSYTPTTPADWTGSPTVGTIQAGLDELADRLTNIPVGATVVTSDTAPLSPSQGDLWYDSVSGRTYIYFNNSWVDTNPSIPGQTGPQGATGAGATGATGVQGEIGATGIQGATGPQGIQGDIGATGATGVQGDMGATGAQGNDGATGVAGEVGATGAQGLDGATGPAGIDGATGATGPQGATGPAGTDASVTTGPTPPSSPTTGMLWYDDVGGRTYIYYGSSWVDTNPSIPGQTGAQGATGAGATGATGVQGATGPDGLSSQFVGTFASPAALLSAFPTPLNNYWAFAKDTDPTILNVYRPDISGWVSETITLPQGATGASGYMGSDGATGVQGDVGATGVQGDIGATGATGAQGATGPAGTSVSIAGSVPDAYVAPANDPQVTLSAAFPSATNGTGVIDANTGDLWVYNGTTWLNVGKVTGPQGATGASGYMGSDGATGPAGLDGATGATGPQGDIGATGAAGWQQQPWQLTSSTAIVSLNSTGTLTVPGDIIPSTTLSYNLGSTSTRWHSLYVGTGTVYIGDLSLSAVTNPEGQVQLEMPSYLTGIDNIGFSSAWHCGITKEAAPTWPAGRFEADGGDGPFEISASSSATIYAGNQLIYMHWNEGVEISTDDSFTANPANRYNTWRFGVDGKLTFPDGAYNYGSTVVAPGVYDIQSVNYTTIRTAANGPGIKTWTFGTDGKLTVQGDIVPDSNNANDLGATGKQWNHLYVNSATIDTGGLTVWGPVTFNGPFNYSGTATVTVSTSATFYGDVYGFGALYAGVVGYTPTPYTVIQTTANIDEYAQNNFQNIDNGPTASTEWVATAANGNDTTNYIDMGIASGTWNGTQANSLGTAVGPNDGYLYVQGGTGGGDLVLGAASSGQAVKILAGQPGSAGIVAVFTSTSVVLSVPLKNVNYTLTSSTGTNGQVLTSNGAGGTAWSSDYATQSYVTTRGYITATTILVGSTASNTLGTGTLWYDTLDGRTYVLYNGSYVDASPDVTYTLVTATNTRLGGVKIGTGLTAASDGTISTTQVISTTSNVTFNNILTTGQIVETFQTFNTSFTTSATINCSLGNTVNVTSVASGNWTANLTNLSLSTNQATNVTLIINQGVTPYVPTTLIVNGTISTINWQGGSTPSGNASKKDVVAFSILQTGTNAYLAFGQLVTFG